jgi:broad specificity phosphatase PhoE
MDRTIQTANILRPHQQVIKDARINDIKTGMEGLPFSEFREALAKSDDPWNARFGEGESFNDEKARTLSFLGDLKKNNYLTVLIVTHGGVGNIIYGLSHNLSNEDTFNREIENASIFEVDIKN